MGKVQRLRRRIRSVRSTRQITKTMEMVSASKLKRAQDRVVAARPFASMMLEVIGALDVDPGLVEHPLMRQPEQPRRGSIYVFTSNRGLAGAFNANLVRKAETLKAELAGDGLEPRLHVAGKKGATALRFRGEKPVNVWVDLSDRPSFEEADRVAQTVIAEFAGGETDAVYLVYSRFNSPVDTPPVIDQILPVGGNLSQRSPPAGGKGGAAAGARERGATRAGRREGPAPLYMLTPSAEQIFAQLLPLYVRNLVYRALIETAAGEHGARRTAMKNATDNAGELLDALHRNYNRARQAQITQEIAELLGGAEALKG